MTTEVLPLALSAGVQSTFGSGRIFYLKSASGPVTITAERSGSGASIRKFTNVTVGFKFKADDGHGWTLLRVLSATTQNIELVIGDDDVEFSNAVSISGSVTTVDTPSGTITASVADTVIATATAYSIPANTGRRRITIGSLGANTGNVRVQSTGAGAARGLELVPGTFVGLATTAALDVRNDTGANQSVYVLEES